MRFFRTKAFVAIVSFMAGMATMFVWNLKRYGFLPNINVQWKTSSEEPVNPFDRADRIHQRMLEEMQKQAESADGFGDSGDELTISEIQEGDKEYFFEVDTHSMPKAQFSVQVDPGQLTLTIQNGEPGSGMQSTIQRSFPVPENVDAGGVQLENGQGKLTVHLPKKR